MHILLTNDDGISSGFLRILAEELHAAGHQLSIAAPAGEQSWISRAVSRRGSVAVTVAEDWPGKAWAIDGTPTDCMNIALGHLVNQPGQPPVDIVISGINVGMNCSIPFVLASGTVAGALEAAFWGLPAMALSQYLDAEVFMSVAKDHGNLPTEVEASVRSGAQHAGRLANEILANGRPHALLEQLGPLDSHEAIVHNVNFPYVCTAETMLELTEPGGMRLGTIYEEETPGRYRFQFNAGTPVTHAFLTDRECVMERSSISYSRLDYTELGRIRQ